MSTRTTTSVAPRVETNAQPSTPCTRPLRAVSSISSWPGASIGLAAACRISSPSYPSCTLSKSIYSCINRASTPLHLPERRCFKCWACSPSSSAASSRNVSVLALRAKSEGKTLERDIETAIRTTLASGTGMIKAAKMHGVGVDTVARISRAKEGITPLKV